MDFVASIAFEAASESDAAALIQSWGLPEGARVTAQATSPAVYVIVGSGGSFRWEDSSPEGVSEAT
jgi:hypothetical protein